MPVPNLPNSSVDVQAEQAPRSFRSEDACSEEHLAAEVGQQGQQGAQFELRSVW